MYRVDDQERALFRASLRELVEAEIKPCVAEWETAFDHCRVPARYLLGEENDGFRLIIIARTRGLVPERR